MTNPNVGHLNRQKILQKLTDVYPNGKSTSELKDELMLHRDTIYELCNSLMMDDLVIKESGKRGKYKLTSKVFSDPSYFSYRLGDKATKDLRRWEYSQDYRKSFYNNASRKCTLFDMQSINDNEKTVPMILTEFGNRIGALIVYQMIEALQFNKLMKVNVNTKKRTKNQLRDKETEKGSEVMKKLKMSGEVVDKLVVDYAKNAIKPFLILNEFLNFVDHERGLLCNKDIMRLSEETESDKSWSFYGIGIENYQMLRKSFAIAYPDIFESVESIKKQLPEMLSGLRERRKELLTSHGKV
jgi:hypothetical protein